LESLRRKINESQNNIKKRVRLRNLERKSRGWKREPDYESEKGKGKVI
jgi:hypothetical protein